MPKTRKERTDRDDGVAGQEGGEVLGHTNGAHTRPAATVRDAEGLVQVEVAHVGTDPPGARQGHLRRREGGRRVKMGVVSALGMD